MDKVPYYEPAYTEETHYSHVCRLAKLNGFDSIKAFSNQYLRFGNEDKELLSVTLPEIWPHFLHPPIYQRLTQIIY